MTFSRYPIVAGSRAAAAEIQDTKDLVGPVYSGDLLQLDDFLEALDYWVRRVTRGYTKEAREDFVYARFVDRLPKKMQRLYIKDERDGKIHDYASSLAWLEEMERIDAPELALKRWHDVKLVHNNVDVALLEWKDFLRDYFLYRDRVEDWNESHEVGRLISMLPKGWRTRVTKEEAKRARRRFTAKIHVTQASHQSILNHIENKVSPTAEAVSLQNALVVTVDGEREWQALQLLKARTIKGTPIRMTQVPCRMTTQEVIDWVTEQAEIEYRNANRTHGRDGEQPHHVHHVAEEAEEAKGATPSYGGQPPTQAPASDPQPVDAEDAHVFAFVAHNLSKGRTTRKEWERPQLKGKGPSKVLRGKEARRIGDPPRSFGEYVKEFPNGCFVCYGRKQRHDHDHKKCKWYADDKAAYNKAKSHNPSSSGKAHVRDVAAEVDKISEQLKALIEKQTPTQPPGGANSSSH